MEFIKKLNLVTGILALLALLTMIVSVAVAENCPPYYVAAAIFLVTGGIFAVTAVFFILRSLFWHLRCRKFSATVRHYLLVYIGFYLLLIVVDHICMRAISWSHNLVYSFVAAFFQTYLEGRRVETTPYLTKKSGKPESAKPAKS